MDFSIRFFFWVELESTTNSDCVNDFSICSINHNRFNLKVFDINLRQHFYTEETIVNSLNKCNVLKINDEELVIVSRMFGYPELSQSDACRRILETYGLKMLILTCGTDGSYVFTSEETSFQPTPKVEVADTVGAGDSFTGAFVASVLKGKALKDAHKRAVEVSAFVCTQNGAMPTLPAELLD